MYIIHNHVKVAKEQLYFNFKMLLEKIMASIKADSSKIDCAAVAAAVRGYHVFQVTWSPTAVDRFVQTRTK